MYSIYLIYVLLYLLNFSFGKIVNITEEMVQVLVYNFLPPKMMFIVDGREAVLGSLEGNNIKQSVALSTEFYYWCSQYLVPHSRFFSNGQFPYIVSLQSEGSHVCAGNLVDMNTVVTAAHCLYKIDQPLQYVAVAGIVDLKDDSWKFRQSEKVVSALYHPDFYIGFWQSDIAILKLEHSFIETPYVQSIKLPPSDYEPSGFGRVVGWGAIQEGKQASNKLMETVLKILNKDKCRYYYGDEIDCTVFCAASFVHHEDTCQGDSGGPLICNNYLCGVISAGIGCGKSDEAGIYTKVSHFTKWIQKYQKNHHFVFEEY